MLCQSTVCLGDVSIVVLGDLNIERFMNWFATTLKIEIIRSYHLWFERGLEHSSFQFLPIDFAEENIFRYVFM